MLSQVIKPLRSLKLTVVLIICLVVIFLLGLIIPQKDLLGRDMYMAWKAENPGLVSFLEFLDFTDIHVSPITLVLWALFFLNLLVVMSGRISPTWRRCVSRDMPADVNALKGKRHYEAIEGRGIGDIETALKGRGYKVFSEGGAFRAVKNRFSPLATLLFHLSFFLLLVGGVISFYTKFSAEAHVAVGETFVGEFEELYRPKIGGVPKTSFTVESVEPAYYEGRVPVNLDVVLNTSEGKRTIGINRPYKKGRQSFVIKDVDVAPRFVIKDAEGNEVDASYFKLGVLQGGEDIFGMAGYDFRVFFYANYLEGFKQKERNVIQDLSKAPMTMRTRQREIVNPAFYVAVFKNDKLLGTKTIAQNEPMEFDGLELYFTDLIYWVRFLAIKEYGLSIIDAGFALMIMALIIRLVLYRRELTGVSENGKLHMAGTSDYYPALFADEFNAIIKKLKGE
jgi:hypothetical protein